MRTKLIFIFIFILSLTSYSFADDSGIVNIESHYTVTIHSANGLVDTDIIGKNNQTDAYVVLYKITKGEYWELCEIAHTQVTNDSRAPKWEESFEISLNTNEYFDDMLVARVVDRDKKKNRDQDLGYVALYCNKENKRQKEPLGEIVQRGSHTIRDPYNDFSKALKRGRGFLNFTIVKKPRSFYLKSYGGKKPDEALKDPLLSLLDVKVKTYFHPQSIYDGQIINQTPNYQEKLTEGDTVTFTVARLKKVIIPDFSKMKYPQALIRAQTLGLSKGYKTEKPTTDPRKNEYIAEQSLKVGRTVSLPAVLNLVVYKYEEPDPVPFPDLVGMSYIEAIRTLRNSGLRPGRVTRQAYDADTGEVISTNPSRKDETELMPNTPVSLVIAAPDMLGLTMAFPIEKKPGEVITLDFDKHEKYYVKFKSDISGYIRIKGPDGNEKLPMSGDIFTDGTTKVAMYSNWKDRRSFRVIPRDYIAELEWDTMTRKDGNAKVSFIYELIPEMDEFEINDTIYDAAYIFAGVRNETAIFPGDDVDWLVYEADADGYLRLNIDSVPDDEIKHYFMFKIYEEGTDVNLHKHETLPVSVKVFQGKKYFIRISILGVDRSIKTFGTTFDLVLEKDSTEPNDSFEKACEIEGNYSGEFYLMGKGEDDFFKLIPPQGADHVRITVEHPEWDMSPRLYWGRSPEELKDSDYCTPKREEHPCNIELNSSEPLYLKLWNDLAHIFSDEPFELNIAYPNDRDGSVDYAKKAYIELVDGNYEKSISLYKKAIELYEDSRYWHDMGMAYFNQKKWEDAKKCFEKAISIKPDYYLAHKSLGSVYGELKDYNASLTEFNTALSLNQDDPMLYYNIARSYEGIYNSDNSKTGALNEALGFSKKALNEIPDNEKVKKQYNRIKQKVSK